MICTRQEYAIALIELQEILYIEHDSEVNYIKKTIFKQLKFKFSETKRDKFLDNYFESSKILKLIYKINLHFITLPTTEDDPDALIDLDDDDGRHYIFKEYVKLKLLGKPTSNAKIFKLLEG
jgi:hypothetical protein